MRWLLAIALAAPALAEDERATDVLALYNHFTVAQVIGESCAQPTLEEATAFTEKFRTLGDLAEREARRANPALPPGEFAKFAARHRHQLQSGVKRFLADHGCAHADAVALAAKYREFQAMDLPD